ncbi:MAG: cation transporter, partial [Clostridia bacterium]|nr:cation transporter [Clostridia bacterium]
MITLLTKIFIKNKDDVKNPKVREAYGKLSGIMGVILNLFLFAGKFIAGLLSGSISITADAFNNLTDAGSSIVTFIGFKLSSKPTDRDHPFGHGRMEYIAGFIVSLIIFLVGFELIKSSVEKLITPTAVEFSYLTLAILIASVLVKLYMFYYNSKIAKKINSVSVKATASDSLNDCIATGVVAVTFIVNKLTGLNIDGIAGLLVALFIIFAGINTAKETIGLLLGCAPESEYVEEIEKTL